MLKAASKRLRTPFEAGLRRTLTENEGSRHGALVAHWAMFSTNSTERAANDQLPIDSRLPDIIEGLASRSLVLVAPPGSGKTTRVPPAISIGPAFGRASAVIVLQPRRVAARASAARIAEEQGWTSATRSATRSDSNGCSHAIPVCAS